jgi:hypothetical protein
MCRARMQFCNFDARLHRSKPVSSVLSGGTLLALILSRYEGAL